MSDILCVIEDYALSPLVARSIYLKFSDCSALGCFLKKLCLESFIGQKSKLLSGRISSYEDVFRYKPVHDACIFINYWW